MDQLLTVPEVASTLRVDKQTVYRLIWADGLSWVNVARDGAKRARIRVRRSAVERYMASRDRQVAS